MDLKEQVARRRAEIAEEDREGDRLIAQMKERARRIEGEQREEAITNIATDLAASGLPVTRSGNDYLLELQPKPIDVTGLRRSKLIQLRNREARRMWTPEENWIVISAIAAGVPLLAFFGIGVLLIAAGLDRRTKLNNKYRTEILSIYPQLKEALEAV